MTQSLSILGATGSVGRSAADIVRQYPDRFHVAALTGNGNAELLAQQARELRPQIAVLADENKYAELKERLSGTGIACAAGKKALLDAAAMKTDMCVAAIAGFAGLEASFAALKSAKRLVFASKECLVAAGDLFLNEAKKHHCEIVPADSEHNAVFQLWEKRNEAAIDKIVLTASGGPFWNLPQSEWRGIKPEQAMAHPVWKMGRKISVDSATLMNKGLEIIEAHYLFDLPGEKIDVLIHPEGVVHAMVSYRDGSTLAHMGPADMRVPLAYALFGGKREKTGVNFDLARLSGLRFLPPDGDKFPSLAMARQAMAQKGALPLVLNAANEVAVERFIAQDIEFIDIFSLTRSVLDWASSQPGYKAAPSSLGDVLELDRETRRAALSFRPGAAVSLAS